MKGDEYALPKVIAKFKCKECQDVFEATSDEFSKCKCGKCNVKPSDYITSYKNDGDSRGCYFEQIETKVYRFKEEYHELNQDFMDIWNKIKAIKEERKYAPPSIYIHEMMDKSDDGNRFLRNVSTELYDVNKYGEYTKLRFDVNLKCKHDDAALLERIEKFYDLFMKIINKEVDINNREEMKSLSSNWNKEQCEMYDYTFYT